MNVRIMMYDSSGHNVPFWVVLFNSVILTFLLYLTFYDLWYVLACWLFAMPITLGLISIQWFWVMLDSGLNPWVNDLELDLWNMFTTKHYSTWLYLMDSKAWISQQVLLMPPIALALIEILLFKEISGLVLGIGDLLLAFLLLILSHIKWENMKPYFKYRSPRYSGKYTGD